MEKIDVDNGHSKYLYKKTNRKEWMELILLDKNEIACKPKSLHRKKIAFVVKQNLRR